MAGETTSGDLRMLVVSASFYSPKVPESCQFVVLHHSVSLRNDPVSCWGLQRKSPRGQTGTHHFTAPTSIGYEAVTFCKEPFAGAAALHPSQHPTHHCWHLCLHAPAALRGSVLWDSLWQQFCLSCGIWETPRKRWGMYIDVCGCFHWDWDQCVLKGRKSSQVWYCIAL